MVRAQIMAAEEGLKAVALEEDNYLRVLVDATKAGTLDADTINSVNARARASARAKEDCQSALQEHGRGLQTLEENGIDAKTLRSHLGDVNGLLASTEGAVQRGLLRQIITKVVLLKDNPAARQHKLDFTQLKSISCL